MPPHCGLDAPHNPVSLEPNPLSHLLQPAVEEDVVVSEPMPQPGDLLIRVARLRFTATQEHFEKGDLVLKCVASLAPPGYLSHQRTGLNGGEIGDYGLVQAGMRQEHSGGSQQQNGGEALRKKEDHRKKVYQEQLQRAMMHFFNTWETTVRGKCSRNYYATTDVILKNKLSNSVAICG